MLAGWCSPRSMHLVIVGSAGSKTASLCAWSVRHSLPVLGVCFWVGYWSGVSWVGCVSRVAVWMMVRRWGFRVGRAVAGVLT